jgi:hypothetical protein
MVMKTSFQFICLSAMMVFSMAGMAQVSLTEDVDYIQREWGRTKKDLINTYMKLQEPQATAFWKVYDAYETERKALGKVRLQLLNDYAMHVESLSPEKADEIAKATLKNNEAYQKLYSTYYGKVKKVIGSIDAAKFIQAEIALQTGINHETQASIPFIGEMDHLKMH